MANDVKHYENEYKKCRTFTKEHVKQAEVLSDRVKFFSYDMRQGLEQLEDIVLEDKASADPIEARTIEDYALVDKAIRELLKDIQFNHGKVEDACKELNKLPKSSYITAGLSTLKDLKKDIEKELKSRDKKDKDRAAIEKLQKKIEDDLKIIDDYAKAVDKIPGSYLKADQEYTTAIRNIMKAKGRPSPKTLKFIALAPKMLTDNILKKTIKQCEDLVKTLDRAAGLAVNSAGKLDDKKLQLHVKDGVNVLKKLQDIVERYSEIKKNFKKEIENMKEQKMIESSIKKIEKIETDAKTSWERASAEATEARAKAQKVKDDAEKNS